MAYCQAFFWRVRRIERGRKKWGKQKEREKEEEEEKEKEEEWK